MKILFLLTVFSGGVLGASRNFRFDYKYDAESDYWFKIHEIESTWLEARLQCQLEGATLASPINDNIMRWFKRNGDQNFFIGLHSLFSATDFVTVEGIPLNRLNHTWHGGQARSNGNKRCVVLTSDMELQLVNCTQHHRYVCYRKHVENIPVNDGCGTIDFGYKLNNLTGSCYKLHKEQCTWERAHMTCLAEGGYLLVIGGTQEAVVVGKILAYPPRLMDEAERYYYAGYNDWDDSGILMTIHGQTREEAGYRGIVTAEPTQSSELRSPREHCGAVNRELGLSRQDCDVKRPFICEKHPDSLL